MDEENPKLKKSKASQQSTSPTIMFLEALEAAPTSQVLTLEGPSTSTFVSSPIGIGLRLSCTTAPLPSSVAYFWRKATLLCYLDTEFSKYVLSIPGLIRANVVESY